MIADVGLFVCQGPGGISAAGAPDDVSGNEVLVDDSSLVQDCELLVIEESVSIFIEDDGEVLTVDIFTVWVLQLYLFAKDFVASFSLLHDLTCCFGDLQLTIWVLNIA